MFEFCPHCGNSIGGQNQVIGQMLICQYCNKEIGIVQGAPEKLTLDRTKELIQSGKAARCPVCAKLVDVKVSGGMRSLVPHFLQEKRKLCTGSGKPAPTPPAPPVALVTPFPSEPKKVPPPKLPATAEKLSAYMKHEVIKVVACSQAGTPTIEELTLNYLDQSDRVRLQIDALRDILGKKFEIRPYPPRLNRPDLAIWGNVDHCVVAKKHEEGGYKQMSEEELLQVVDDLGRTKSLFFKLD